MTTNQSFIPETGIESTVVRPGYLRGCDASNGGITGRSTTVLIVRRDTDPARLNLRDRDRAVVLQTRNVFGVVHASLVPLVGKRAGHVAWMHGGTHVGIGPVLRAELALLGAEISTEVAVHDRQESAQVYASMSD